MSKEGIDTHRRKRFIVTGKKKDLGADVWY